MTTKARWSLNGFEAYLEQIQQAGQDIDAAADRALARGAKVIHAEMVRLVPKDEHDLEKSLVIVGPFQDGNLHFVEVGVVGASERIATYGNVQEYGSPGKNIRPQSYIRAGTDGKRAAYRAEVRDSLKSEGFVD